MAMTLPIGRRFTNLGNNPNNADTDGDGTEDSEDGWAGSASDEAENAIRAMLKPARLPVERYRMTVRAEGNS